MCSHNTAVAVRSLAMPNARVQRTAAGPLTAAITGVLALVAAFGFLMESEGPSTLLQRRAVLVDVFPPTPAWGATPASVGQVGNGDAARPGQDSNVLGGSYHFPDYAQRGLPYGRGRFLEQIFPETPPWGTTPGSIGAVGAGQNPAPGQDINVFGGDYVFPAYVRGSSGYVPYVQLRRPTTFQAKARQGQALLIPSAAKLWGGEYSSVGKFPAGFNGQRSYGGEWNVWALPTEEQMANSGCDEPCLDGPLASIGEHNVLDGLGNDPDSSVWTPAAGDQPAGTTGNCCGQSALGEAGGYEEPTHAWLSA